MQWNFRHVLAPLFVIETAWLLLRSVVYVAEGWPVNLPWSVGLVLGPAVLLSAAWFVRRKEPPTLLLAALARTLVLSVAVAWNLLLLYGVTKGHVTLV